jgi:hypothetical protein
MSKKKKNTITLNKLNLVRAQYKKEFYEKVQHFLNELCEEKLYHQIPAFYLETIYEYRSHPLRAVPAKGYKFPVVFVEGIKYTLSNHLKDITIDINKNGLEISLYDFITIFFSILKFSLMIKEDDFPGAEKIKTKLIHLVYKNNVEDLFLEKLINILQGVISLNNTIGKCIYWVNYERTGFDKLYCGIENIAYIYSYVPEIISVEINGIARPVFAFKWALPQIGPEFMSIKPSMFIIKSPFAEIPMNI